ncbi:hypothetical protein JQ543_06905 [Bradyrhizobium diazoefficiens]|nr:hypothetical protein [Bradyrhizobium diazoefficiens]MBR0847464.1 hypothetical protein [Bradyrhizobium diazoefficiens]
MRITAKVYASWMPVPDPRKINDLAERAHQTAGFDLGNPGAKLHAIGAPGCGKSVLEKGFSPAQGFRDGGARDQQDI